MSVHPSSNDAASSIHQHSEKSLSPPPRIKTIKQRLDEDLDAAHFNIPLVLYCFTTGMIDCVTFSATFIWCAFQTGNTIQLSIALARLFTGPKPRDISFHIADKQALTSLLTFLFGASLGRLNGDRPRRRSWLFLSTLTQAALVLIASLVILYSSQSDEVSSRSEPSWTNAYGFAALGLCSMALGLQAVTAKQADVKAFGTSVVLTTIWVELVNEKALLNWRKLSPPRDLRTLAIVALFIGGLVSRAILASIGSSATLGLIAGFKLITAFVWLFVVPAVIEKV